MELSERDRKNYMQAKTISSRITLFVELNNYMLEDFLKHFLLDDQRKPGEDDLFLVIGSEREVSQPRG